MSTASAVAATLRLMPLSTSAAISPFCAPTTASAFTCTTRSPQAATRTSPNSCEMFTMGAGPTGYCSSMVRVCSTFERASSATMPGPISSSALRPT
jgi:hypothetical protein